MKLSNYYLYMKVTLVINQVKPVFNGVSQNQSNTCDQLEQRFIISVANENPKWTQGNRLQRGKTRMTKSQLFWVLHLIGREKGANFLGHTETNAIPD